MGESRQQPQIVKSRNLCHLGYVIMCEVCTVRILWMNIFTIFSMFSWNGRWRTFIILDFIYITTDRVFFFFGGRKVPHIFSISLINFSNIIFIYYKKNIHNSILIKECGNFQKHNSRNSSGRRATSDHRKIVVENHNVACFLNELC